MKHKQIERLVVISLIGALYTVCTLAFAPISFGAVQFRVSEALTLLPLLSPTSIWGLVFGCFLSNLIGFFTGLNPIGLIDAVVGTAATLFAALCTYVIGRLPIKRWAQLLLAPLPPVLFNGVIVGLELSFVFGGEPGQSFAALFAFHGLSVAAGEAVVCYTLGILLLSALLHRQFYRRLFRVDQKI